jgi:hypothetical protein
VTTLALPMAVLSVSRGFLDTLPNKAMPTLTLPKPRRTAVERVTGKFTHRLYCHRINVSKQPVLTPKQGP